ncbi:MAG TPA: type II secretion system F family protein [Gaiellaceae bacterium]|nr:type II secretion system F family protein [Gaiellaceae bacterium]
MVALPFLVAIAVYLLVTRVAARRQAGYAGQRIAAYVDAPRVTAPALDDEVLTSGSRRFAASEPHLARLPGFARLRRLVERADAPLSAAELVWLGAVACVAVAVVGFVSGAAPIVVLLLVAMVAAGAWLWLAVLIARRRKAFDEQLPEFLVDVGSALRAGHAFNQALQAVADEAPSPIGNEFARVIVETRLGRALEDALADLGNRIDSRDLQFVIDAIVVQREVGGSLAGVFAIVAESVRQRQQHAMRVRSLTAMGRLSATVVLALPLVLAVLLSLVNHGYLGPLWHERQGQVMLGVSFALLGVGALWLRSLVSSGDAA